MDELTEERNQQVEQGTIQLVEGVERSCNEDDSMQFEENSNVLDSPIRK